MRCPHSALSSESSGVRCPHSALSLLFFVCRVHGAQGWWMHVWGTVVTTTMTTSALGRGGKRRAQAGGGPSQPPQLPAANKSQRPTRRTQVSMRLSLVWEWLLAHVGASDSHPHATGKVRAAGRYPGKLYGKEKLQDIVMNLDSIDSTVVTGPSARLSRHNAVDIAMVHMAHKDAPSPPNDLRLPLLLLLDDGGSLTTHWTPPGPIEDLTFNEITTLCASLRAGWCPMLAGGQPQVGLPGEPIAIWHDTCIVLELFKAQAWFEQSHGKAITSIHLEGNVSMMVVLLAVATSDTRNSDGRAGLGLKDHRRTHFYKGFKRTPWHLTVCTDIHGVCLVP